MFVGDSLVSNRATICDELATHVQHFYVGGLVVRGHRPCDVVWKQECGASPDMRLLKSLG